MEFHSKINPLNLTIMSLEKLPFSYNWNNKLSCNVFTSVRLKNDNKYILNNIYEITLRNSKENIHISQGNAQLVLMHHFKLLEVSEGIAMIDTGYTKDKFIELVKTMYKNYKIDFDKHLMTLLFLKYV
jgi:hypothetical protein